MGSAQTTLRTPPMNGWLGPMYTVLDFRSTVFSGAVAPLPFPGRGAQECSSPALLSIKYADETGCPAVVSRAGELSGAHATKPEACLMNSFGYLPLRAGREGRPSGSFTNGCPWSSTPEKARRVFPRSGLEPMKIPSSRNIPAKSRPTTGTA